MFEVRVREIQPMRGLAFLEDLKRTLPWPAGVPQDFSLIFEVGEPMEPRRLLSILEPLAQGFQAWGKGFR
jgi:hypothetical protein